MLIGSVKPMHCKDLINKMDKMGYAGSTIRQTYEALGTMFKSALANGIITKHPFDTLTSPKKVKPPDDINFMTVREPSRKDLPRR